MMITSSEKTKAPVAAGADERTKQTPTILAGAQKASNLEAAPLIAALSPITSRVRTDVTARKGVDGEQRWTREPLTDDRLNQHLTSGPYRGCCPINAGESVTRLGLYDLDSHKGEVSWAEMTAVAQELAETMEVFGLRPIPFRSSGGRGIHIFAIWDTPQDAHSVRKQLTDVLEVVGFTDGAGGVKVKQIEVFPKQDQVPEGRYGNQFILPLAGKSEPLDPLFGWEPMGKDYARHMEWPVSTPVPLVQREERAKPSGMRVVPSGDLARLEGALAAIPNKDAGLNYDAWRNVIFAIHHATGGSDEGLALAHEFSAKSVKYNPDFLDVEVWPYVRDRDGGITERTLFKMAEAHGWVDCSPDDFGDEVSKVPLRPDYDRNLKTGEIKATAGNTVKALSDRRECGMDLAYDEFRDEICYSSDNGESWIPFRDADYMRLRIRLEQIGFRTPTKEITRDAVQLVAENHAFDSAQEWLKRLTWDGVPRVERFFATYFGTPDTPYTRAVGRYAWTALAGRVMEPGCKADMLPILYGAQGLRKSSGVAAIAPSEDFFTEVSFHEKDDDLSRKMRGHLVAELGELRGLHSKDLESIKSWTTRRFEKWVPKFKEFSTQYPRRLVIFGTTNEKDFLADQTGNRRWLPLEVGLADVDGIARDRLQLWAEGRELFARGGVDFKEAETLAIGEHGEYTMADAWEDSVQCWLNTEGELDGRRPCDQEFVGSLDIFTQALNVEPRNLTRALAMRLSRVMKALGYESTRKSVDGGRARGWVRTCRNLHVHPHIAE